MKQLISAMALIFIFAQAAVAEELTGEVRDFATDAVLFQMKSSIQENGADFARTNTFTSPDGLVAVVEDAKAKDGVVEVFTVEQKQTGEKGRIEVQEGKVKFTYTDSKGKTKTSEEKLASNFVVPLTVLPYLAKNWDALMKGDKIQVRLGVWFRVESVGFRFFKKQESTYKGRPAIDVVMNPTSWVIRQLVDDLVFTFDAKTKQLVMLKGRVPPKKKDGSGWKDLDAITTYNVKLD